MSSDDLYKSIDDADLALMRGVLERAGFSHAEPMAELDRDAARFVIAQFQHGIRSSEDLRFALAHRAEAAVMSVSSGDGGLET